METEKFQPIVFFLWNIINLTLFNDSFLLFHAVNKKQQRFSHGPLQSCLRPCEVKPHVASRRPSPSASASGFNPLWRTWQIILAPQAL